MTTMRMSLVPQQGYLLVGACPICTRTELHQHPVPIETLLHLLGAVEAGEELPEIEEPCEPETDQPRPGLPRAIAALCIIAVYTQYMCTKTVIRAAIALYQDMHRKDDR